MSGGNNCVENLKPTIAKLREMREQLCSKQLAWKEAFAVRDFVLSELTTLMEMLEDTDIDRSKCIEQTKKILVAFDDNNTSEK